MAGAGPPSEPPHRQQVRIGTAELSVLTAGDGEPVLLLHGTPTGAELWRRVLPLLAAEGYHATAPDLPGYGQTVLAPQADHSLAGAAALLAHYLEQHGRGPVWLVGHDTGGAVAQLLAARRPELVARLTLLNSIVDGSWPAPRARFATAAAKLGLYRAAAGLGVVPNAYMRRQVRRACAPPCPVTDEEMDRVVWDTKFSSPGGRAAFERHLKALTPQDTTAVVADLPHLTVPCQLVWGLQDPFQRWEVGGERLRALLPSPNVTELAHCGHLVPLEDERGLVQAMLQWRAQTS